MTVSMHSDSPIVTGVESALSRFGRYEVLNPVELEPLVEAVTTIYDKLGFDIPDPGDSSRKRLQDDFTADLVSTALVAYGTHGEQLPQAFYEELREFVRRILNGLAEPE